MSCRLSGGSVLSTECSAATSRVSMFVVLIEGGWGGGGGGGGGAGERGESDGMERERRGRRKGR